MRKFWAKEEKSKALEPILDQEELDGVSEDTEAVISGKEPLLSGKEEQLLLPGGTGSVVSNRDVQVQVETEHLTSNRDVDVQIETEHLTSNIDVEVQVKTEQVSNRDVEVQVKTESVSNRDVEVQVKAEQISNRDVEVQVKAEQLIFNRDVEVQVKTEPVSILKFRDVEVQVKTEQLISNRDVEVQVKIEQIISNRDVKVQVETGPVSNTDVTVQTDGDTEIEDRRKNENRAKELANKQAVIESHENQLADYYQSILELKAELKMAQEKNDVHIQKRSQGHQSLVEELQGEISKALVQNHELKEAMFTITRNEGLREQPENKVKRENNLNDKIVRMTNIKDQMKKELSTANDVICSLKKELQKRDLEKGCKIRRDG
ncbi:uncharacterized protein [Palaemon carinicauda]|uniref:uncharacterized protein n=1 Tax=Palaemon carinicauda TaxID=392227 RepID=UPI0035B6197D